MHEQYPLSRQERNEFRRIQRRLTADLPATGPHRSTVVLSAVAVIGCALIWAGTMMVASSAVVGGLVITFGALLLAPVALVRFGGLFRKQ